jgi:phosphoglycerate dehydrogenase-like enzyme
MVAVHSEDTGVLECPISQAAQAKLIAELEAAVAAARSSAEQEPPPAGHPVLGLPNIITAPHVAGVTREAVDRMSEQTARNILSALDGAPIRANVINPDVLG